jgi:D-glycero-D-manno-heptose 1,7-bisphosphate phosphatase
MKGLFLDRDGVINVENNYVHKVADFIFTDYVFDLCRAAKQKDYKIIVITNQAGIGRGLYSESDFADLTRWMIDVFVSQEIVIEKVYFCPFHKEHGIGYYRQDSFDRKPNPGMIIKALKEFGISANDSILIGDKLSDIKAGQAASIRTNLLLSKDNNSENNSYIEISDLKNAIHYL